MRNSGDDGELFVRGEIESCDANSVDASEALSQNRGWYARDVMPIAIPVDSGARRSFGTKNKKFPQKFPA
jgi:hypothetical protein